MKRWILFLALFGVGLAILVWIDRGRRPERHPAEPQPEPGAQQTPGELTEVPIGRADKTVPAAVAGAGAFATSAFDRETGKPLYRITARNHESLGDGVYRFDQLVGRFYVPGTDTLRMEVTADTARGKLTTVPVIDFDLAHPIELD